MHLARHAGRHYPRRHRARIEERAIDHRARRVHVLTDAGRTHVRTLAPQRDDPIPPDKQSREIHEFRSDPKARSVRELTAVVTEITGKQFRLFRAGGLGMLGTLIKVARAVPPGEKELYPAWQGMQYMLNMFDGRDKLQPLDNDRYPRIRWTTARDVLSARQVR